MGKAWRKFAKAVRTGWCSFWHDNPSWPVNGAYHCRTCGLVYRVVWANRPAEPVEQEVHPGALTTVETHG